MAKKADMFYYDNFKDTASICVKQATYLVECLTNWDVSKINEYLTTMHEYEHLADDKKHEMSEALSKAFITPIEREDLAELSSNLDEVADSIEEVLQRFYVDEPATITGESIQLANKVLECCVALEKMFNELPNFNKPQKLTQTLLEIRDIEEDCDKRYLEAYKNAKNEFKTALDIISWRKIYDYLEQCADACEHVADVVSIIVLKNS